MKRVFVAVGCNGLTNLSRTNSSVLLTKLQFACSDAELVINQLNATELVDASLRNEGDDLGAVMYIVAVLVFYSMCIVIMIVKYLRRAKSELEDERVLEDFFRGMPQYMKEREQNRVNNYAIHAFHALTSVSDGDTIDKGLNDPCYDVDLDDNDMDSDDMLADNEMDAQVPENKCNPSDIRGDREKETFVELGQNSPPDYRIYSNYSKENTLEI
ncbi:hypothetical protein ACF0H5_004957 [Mactra antiquata]